MTRIFRTNLGAVMCLLLGAAVGAMCFALGASGFEGVAAAFGAAALALALGRDATDRADREALAEELEALAQAAQAGQIAGEEARVLSEQTIAAAEDAMRAAANSAARPDPAVRRAVDSLETRLAGALGRLAALEETPTAAPDEAARKRIGALERAVAALAERQEALPAQLAAAAPPAATMSALDGRLAALEYAMTALRGGPDADAPQPPASNAVVMTPLMDLGAGEAAYSLITLSEPPQSGPAGAADLALLEAAASVASELAASGRAGGVLAPLTQGRIGDPAFLDALGMIARDAPAMRGRGGLIVSQADFRAALNAAAPLERISEAGLFLCLADIRDWRLELEAMARAACRLLFVDPERVASEAGATGDPSRLGRALAARGLYLVARDLMTHEDVAAASAVGVRYGAGPAV